MFNHIPLPPREPLVEDLSAGRVYTFDESRRYPSITTVLSATADKSGIDAWRARTGEEAANEISRKATKHGTEIHLLMENFLNGNQIPEASFKSKQVFKLLSSIISKRVTNVYGIEYPLYSDSLKGAGRTDLICNFSSDDVILDWKTSKEAGPKRQEWILDYKLQTCFYARCVNENFDLKITKGVLVFCNAFGITIDRFNVAEYNSILEDRFKAYYEMLR